MIRSVTTLFFWLCTLVVSAQSPPETQPDQPNILWLTFEDTSPEFIGCYGNKAAKTPVMDKLAAEGTRFTSAFSTGSVCSPSRNALILGCKTYTLGTGNHRSNYPIPDFMTGFPTYLRAALGREASYYTTNNSKTDYNTSAEKRIIRESWDESSDQAGWWNRKAGQPFFAVFNSMSSHQSRTMTLPFSFYEQQVTDKLRPDQLTADQAALLPPFFRDSPEMRRQAARIYNAITKTDTEFGEILARLEREGLRENTIIFVFADHGEGMPDAKTNGKALGHRVPFIVWFPEKYRHLSPWKQNGPIQAGTVTDEKIDFADLGPTVLSLAGVKIPAYMQGRPLAGTVRQPEPASLFLSTDRSDESYDLTRTVIRGRYAYTRVFMPYVPELRYLQYMDTGEITAQIRRDFTNGLLSPVQQQMLRPRPAEFLYDLDADPWEVNNLALNPTNDSLLRTFRAQLRDHVLAQRDVLFLPEYELARLPKTTNAYSFRQEDDRYPIRAIYAAAELSGFRDGATLKKQIALLSDANPIVRYWALLGLKNHRTVARRTGARGEAALRPYRSQLTLRLTDDYPPNQVLAASLLDELFSDEVAKSVLLRHLDAPEDHLANLVMQQLLYQTNAALWTPVVRQVQARKKEEKTLANTLRSFSVFRYLHDGETLQPN